MEINTHLSPEPVQNSQTVNRQPTKALKLDEIGEWSELKLDILKKYAGAYCTILRARNLHPIYIDGFAGAGTHIRKKTKELVPGSPLNALNLEPAFEELHLIDSDENRVAELKRLTAGKKNVHVHGGDANQILPNKVFPTIKFGQLYTRLIHSYFSFGTLVTVIGNVPSARF